MEAEIQEAIKQAREKNKGKIAPAKDIYEAIFKAGQEEERKGGTNSIAFLEGVKEGEKRGRESL